MAGLNKVQIIGRLGADPEVRSLPSGGSVANLSIATSEKWTDKNTGQKQERTEWHRVSLFNRLAEVAGQYLHKGSQVYVEGSLQTRKWTDQNGADRYSTDIKGMSMQMLDGAGGGQPQQQPQGYGQPPQQAPQQAPSQQPQYGQQQAPNQGYQQPAQSGAMDRVPAPEFEDPDLPF